MDAPVAQSTDTAALTAKAMEHYKRQRDHLELQVMALDSRLTAAQEENQRLVARLAELEAAAAPPELPEKPVKSKKEA